MHRWFRRVVAAVTRNGSLKLVALVVAVGLWWGVNRQNVVERILDVPVQYQVGNARMVVLRGPQRAQLTVQGPASVVRALTPDQFLLSIALDRFEPGARIVHLAPDMVQHRVPRIRVSRIRPAQVTLVLDALTTKSVPVQPQFVGTPAPGYRLTQVTTEPTTVTAEGPASLVDRVHAALTEPINIHMRTQSLQTTVQVGVDSPEWRVVEPRAVRVVVQIEEVTEAVRLRLAVEAVDFPAGWTFTPRQVEGTFWVPRSKQALFESDPPQVVARWTGGTPQRGQAVTLTVEWPEALRGTIARWRLQPDIVRLVPRWRK
ncbi:MAG: CdaR family protein [Acidobacteria bacterium]|nr:CdaR family protein [Acidobacteriota bacterium]MDW7984421.1 CdaR family protein [Acidobacteriota bacterium]